MLQPLISDTLSGLISHLVHDKLLTINMAKSAVNEATNQGTPITTYLINNHILTSDAIFQSSKKIFGVIPYNENEYNIEKLPNVLTSDLMKRYHIIPLAKSNNILHIGVTDPTDQSAFDSLAFATGLKIIPILMQENQLTPLIKNYSTPLQTTNLEITFLKELAPEKNHSVKESAVDYDEPLIKFTDNIILHALEKSASDIHIEPFENVYRIRYRQDGILYEISEIPTILATRLITRLKVIAKLDISERRLPQDGRLRFEHQSVGHIDIRINTCPIFQGEKIVLRLLDIYKSSLDITCLGFTEPQKNVFLSILNKSQGMILVTGPTGCGKTVTLYSALRHLNTTEKNISTVEDPVEIQLKGINQVNINPKIGLPFSTILRSLLRQDPDIIMVGEIRDLETADIAIQAAQTGHLILSTVHTNNAVETIMRLQSLGIPLHSLANTISLIIAQRLVRTLCLHCKQPEKILLSTLTKKASNETITIYRAEGCKQCLQGYKGRIAIYEVLPITPLLSKLILSGLNTLDLLAHLKQENFPTLYQSGLDKVYQGITSMAEINRVIR